MMKNHHFGENIDFSRILTKFNNISRFKLQNSRLFWYLAMNQRENSPQLQKMFTATIIYINQ